MTNSEFEELIIKSRNGDSEAFENTLNNLKHYFKYKANEYKDQLGRGYDVDDLIQEAAIGVWKGLYSYKEGSKYARTYFLVVARNSMKKNDTRHKSETI